MASTLLNGHVFSLATPDMSYWPSEDKRLYKELAPKVELFQNHNTPLTAEEQNLWESRWPEMGIYGRMKWSHPCPSWGGKIKLSGPRQKERELLQELDHVYGHIITKYDTVADVRWLRALHDQVKERSSELGSSKPHLTRKDLHEWTRNVSKTSWDAATRAAAMTLSDFEKDTSGIVDEVYALKIKLLSFTEYHHRPKTGRPKRPAPGRSFQGIPLDKPQKKPRRERWGASFEQRERVRGLILKHGGENGPPFVPRTSKDLYPTPWIPRRYKLSLGTGSQKFQIFVEGMLPAESVDDLVTELRSVPEFTVLYVTKKADDADPKKKHCLVTLTVEVPETPRP